MFKIAKFFLRSQSTLAEASQKILAVNLVGRDYTTPYSLTPVELKSLLWTALDLKHLSKSKSTNMPSMKNINVGVLLDSSNITQIPLKLASNVLGATTDLLIDNSWKKNYIFVSDFGRLLALSSHIIFCQTSEQNIIEEIADGANVPVVGINSSKYNVLKTLADLMSIYEYFNRFKYLNLSWIGKPDPLFNTYLLLLPQLKINIKFFLTEEKKDEQVMEQARKYSQIYNSEIHETYGLIDTVFRANIICTNAHDTSNYKITLEDSKEASLNWVFLHELPRNGVEVATEVINHKNSLVWKSQENLQWIFAAMITRLLSSYDHYLPEPTFDSDEFVNTGKL